MIYAIIALFVSVVALGIGLVVAFVTMLRLRHEIAALDVALTLLSRRHDATECKVGRLEHPYVDPFEDLYTGIFG